jgi:hypothetical protein
MPCTFCGWISVLVYIYIYRFCIPVHFVEFSFVLDAYIFICSCNIQGTKDPHYSLSYGASAFLTSLNFTMQPNPSLWIWSILI